MLQRLPGCPRPGCRRRLPSPSPGRVQVRQNRTATSGNRDRFLRYSLLMSPSRRPRCRTAFFFFFFFFFFFVFGRRVGHRAGTGVARPCRQARRCSPDGGQHVGGAAVKLDDVPFGGRGGREDVRDRHPAGADRGHGVVLGHRAVLDVQVADLVAEPAQERGHGLGRRPPPSTCRLPGAPSGPGRGPAPRARSRRRHGPTRSQVVVAEPQSQVRGPGGGLVEVAGEGFDRVASANRAGDTDGTMTVSAPTILAPSSRVPASAPGPSRVPRIRQGPHRRGLRGAGAGRSARRRARRHRSRSPGSPEHCVAADREPSRNVYNWRAGGLIVILRSLSAPGF